MAYAEGKILAQKNKPFPEGNGLVLFTIQLIV